jgi:hypothetical protein
MVTREYVDPVGDIVLIEGEDGPPEQPTPGRGDDRSVTRHVV